MKVKIIYENMPVEIAVKIGATIGNGEMRRNDCISFAYSSDGKYKTLLFSNEDKLTIDTHGVLMQTKNFICELKENITRIYFYIGEINENKTDIHQIYTKD